MFIKVKNKIIEVIFLLACTIMALNLLIDFGVIDYYTNQIFQQILVVGIMYAALSRLLSYRKKYNLIMIIGQIYFFALCAVFYYSNNIADFVAAIICFYIDLEVIMGAKTIRDKEDMKRSS